MQSNSEKNLENDSKKKYWQGIMQEWKKSGLKKKIFCEQSGVNYHTFSYWQIRCFPKDTDAKKKFAKVELKPSLNPKNDQPIVIELPSQLKITIPQSFDAQHLASLLKVLGVIHA